MESSRSHNRPATPRPGEPSPAPENEAIVRLRLHENLAGLTAYYANGRERATYFYGNGQVSQEHITDPDGSSFCLSYYEDGQLRSQSAHNPDKSGFSVHYHPNEQPEDEHIYVGGRSACSSFHATGKLNWRMFGSSLVDLHLHTATKSEMERFQEVKTLALEAIGRLSLEPLGASFADLKRSRKIAQLVT